jgi:hypothetical protein
MTNCEVADSFIGLEPCESAPKGFTNAITLMLNCPDLVDDESAQHPGVRFYHLKLTRANVQELMRYLDEDWRDHCAANGIPQE